MAIKSTGTGRDGQDTDTDERDQREGGQLGSMVQYCPNLASKSLVLPGSDLSEGQIEQIRIDTGVSKPCMEGLVLFLGDLLEQGSRESTIEGLKEEFEKTDDPRKVDDAARALIASAKVEYPEVSVKPDVEPLEPQEGELEGGALGADGGGIVSYTEPADPASGGEAPDAVQVGGSPGANPAAPGLTIAQPDPLVTVRAWLEAATSDAQRARIIAFASDYLECSAAKVLQDIKQLPPETAAVSPAISQSPADCPPLQLRHIAMCFNHLRQGADSASSDLFLRRTGRILDVKPDEITAAFQAFRAAHPEFAVKPPYDGKSEGKGVSELDYNNPVKDLWRETWVRMLEQTFEPEVRDRLRVICLPAREVRPEVKQYHYLGIPAGQIVGVEIAEKVWSEFKRNAEAEGIRAEKGSIADRLAPQAEAERMRLSWFRSPGHFHIVSVDLAGPICPDNEAIMSQIKLPVGAGSDYGVDDTLVVLLNQQGCRGSPGSAEMLTVALASEQSRQMAHAVQEWNGERLAREADRTARMGGVSDDVTSILNNEEDSKVLLDEGREAMLEMIRLMYPDDVPNLDAAVAARTEQLGELPFAHALALRIGESIEANKVEYEVEADGERYIARERADAEIDQLGPLVDQTGDRKRFQSLIGRASAGKLIEVYERKLREIADMPQALDQKQEQKVLKQLDVFRERISKKLNSRIEACQLADSVETAYSEAEAIRPGDPPLVVEARRRLSEAVRGRAEKLEADCPVRNLGPVDAVTIDNEALAKRLAKAGVAELVQGHASQLADLGARWNSVPQNEREPVLERLKLFRDAICEKLERAQSKLLVEQLLPARTEWSSTHPDEPLELRAERDALISAVVKKVYELDDRSERLSDQSRQEARDRFGEAAILDLVGVARRDSYASQSEVMRKFDEAIEARKHKLGLDSNMAVIGTREMIPRVSSMGIQLFQELNGIVPDIEAPPFDMITKGSLGDLLAGFARHCCFAKPIMGSYTDTLYYSQSKGQGTPYHSRYQTIHYPTDLREFYESLSKTSKFLADSAAELIMYRRSIVPAFVDGERDSQTPAGDPARAQPAQVDGREPLPKLSSFAPRLAAAEDKEREAFRVEDDLVDLMNEKWRLDRPAATRDTGIRLSTLVKFEVCRIDGDEPEPVVEKDPRIAIEPEKYELRLTNAHHRRDEDMVRSRINLKDFLTDLRTFVTSGYSYDGLPHRPVSLLHQVTHVTDQEGRFIINPRGQAGRDSAEQEVEVG